MAERVERGAEGRGRGAESRAGVGRGGGGGGGRLGGPHRGGGGDAGGKGRGDGCCLRVGGLDLHLLRRPGGPDLGLEVLGPLRLRIESILEETAFDLKG